MAKVELFINNVIVDLTEDVTIPLTFSIADIRNPDKRNTSFSKTIRVPGTKSNNTLFTYIFEINRITQTSNPLINFQPDFNANLKASALLFVDSIQQFKGIAQLVSIKNNNDSYEYEIVLFGDLSNIITEFGSKLLSDLDLSEYDHEYTRDVQIDSWDSFTTINGTPTAFQYGVGYIYPFIIHGDENITDYKPNDFFPAIAFKTYLDKMFSVAGFTYDSAFFNSAFFKRLYLPYSDIDTKLTQSEINNRLFKAFGATPFTDLIDNTYTSPNANASIFNVSQTNTKTITLINDSTSGNYDPNDVYDTSLGTFNVPNSGTYSFDIVGDINVNIESLTSGVIVAGLLSTLKIELFEDSTPLSPIYTTTLFLSSTDSNTFNVNVTTTDLVLTQGNIIQLRSVFSDVGQVYTFDYTLLPATSDLRFNYEATNVTFKNNLKSTTTQEGDTMYINSTLPPIKQSEFFMSIVKAFNLYVRPDKDVTNLLHIDPRDDFYTGNEIVDWTDKLDLSKDIVIKPLGELTSLNYEYNYKPDTDYLNEKYTKSTNLVYGNYTETIINDFLKDTNKTELIFSPTPLIGSNSHNRVCPQFVSVTTDSTGSKTYSPKKVNPRMLYYGGVKSCDAWNFNSDLGATVVKTTYPYIGHLDDPFTPTKDLNFGVPNEVYWNLVNSYTTDNLFNRYHKKFLTEITDRDSKIVTAYSKLNPLDFFNLDFSNYIFIDGTYYILNKVEDADINENTSYKCELLKLKNAPSYIASSIPPPTVPITDSGLIQGGLDEVRAISATSTWYIIQGGLDEVRSMSATSPITIIQG